MNPVYCHVYTGLADRDGKACGNQEAEAARSFKFHTLKLIVKCIVLVNVPAAPDVFLIVLEGRKSELPAV